MATFEKSSISKPEMDIMNKSTKMDVISWFGEIKRIEPSLTKVCSMIFVCYLVYPFFCSFAVIHCSTSIFEKLIRSFNEQCSKKWSHASCAVSVTHLISEITHVDSELNYTHWHFMVRRVRMIIWLIRKWVRAFTLPLSLSRPSYEYFPFISFQIACLWFRYSSHLSLCSAFKFIAAHKYCLNVIHSHYKRVIIHCALYDSIVSSYCCS